MSACWGMLMLSVGAFFNKTGYEMLKIASVFSFVFQGFLALPSGLRVR